eukprot:3825403-Prymnesium_polylepis.2
MAVLRNTPTVPGALKTGLGVTIDLALLCSLREPPARRDGASCAASPELPPCAPSLYSLPLLPPCAAC